MSAYRGAPRVGNHCGKDGEGAVYFVTEREKQYLVKGLIPKSRSADVAPELRGWNWNQPPLEPVYDTRLALYEVAGRYCPTARDIYVRRVLRARSEPSPAMVSGSYYHALLAEVITRAKRLLYQHGVAGSQEALVALKEFPEQIEATALAGLDTGTAAQVREAGRALWEFENLRIAARVMETISAHPHLGDDALISLAVPVVVEQRLDGSLIGLSSQLSADASVMSEAVVLDLKFGEPRDFHRLTTTGYAMVMESIYEYPVTIGCIVYAKFEHGHWSVQKDFHIIDDELRQRFIEERDEKMRIVAEQIDPGVPEGCPRWCQYYAVCHG